MTARSRILTALAAGFFAAWSLPADAGAGGAARPARQHRAHGGAASGSVHRETTRTGPDGVSRTSQKDTTWQRGDGKVTRDTTWTGANGKTATRHTEVQKTEDGRTSQTTVTHPDGSTTTRSSSVSRAPAAGGAPAPEPPAAE
jgi:hypothetical protein